MPLSTARTRKGPNAVAPLWQIKPTGPVRPSAPRDDAVAQISSLTFARPRQLGPLKRKPDSPAKGAGLACQVTTVLDAPFGEPGRNDDGSAHTLTMTLL